MTATIADVHTHRLDRPGTWLPNAPGAAMQIEDMSLAHRLHLAASLIDGAPMHAAAYRLYHDQIVGQPCPPIGNPLQWMKERPLFIALVRELPHKRNTLRPLAERTRHEIACYGNGSCGCTLTPAISPATLGMIQTAARLAKSVTA